MGRTRESMQHIRTAGNPSKLSEAELKQREAEENTPLTAAQESELAQLDKLIQKALKAAGRGQSWKGRRNPAIANLAVLYKLRRDVVNQRRTPHDAEDALETVARIMRGDK